MPDMAKQHNRQHAIRQDSRNADSEIDPERLLMTLAEITLYRFGVLGGDCTLCLHALDLLKEGPLSFFRPTDSHPGKNGGYANQTEAADDESSFGRIGHGQYS